MAAQMNAMQKYVVSRTLEEPLEWRTGRMYGGDDNHRRRAP